METTPKIVKRSSPRVSIRARVCPDRGALPEVSAALLKTARLIQRPQYSSNEDPIGSHIHVVDFSHKGELP
jgi:hypothetical protein